MTPAQKLTRTPRSIYAEVAGTVRDGAVTADKLAAGAVAAHSLQSGSVTKDKLAPDAAVRSLNGLQDQVTLVGGEGISVTPTGDSRLVLAAVAACSTNCYWMLTGNPSTDGGVVNYLGTTDKQPLNLRVGGAAADRVMRYEFPAATASPRLIGGHQGNSVTATGGTIGGGGFSSEPNSVAATYSTIGGGSTNSIQSTSDYGFIGGGRRNLVTTGADYGVLVGGRDNTIGLSADYASLLGGYRNTNDVSYGTIGGGNRNLVKSNALYSVVGGGQGNTVGNSATAGAIGGGATNTIADYADYVTVGGGALNFATADFATISGGANSSIAALSTHGSVGGGERNTILQQSPHATIAGGGQNEINYNSQGASIGGGKTNRIRIFSPFSTIAGGGANTVQEFSPNATIGGGSGNLILPYNPYATIPGGFGARTTNYAQQAYAGGTFSAPGDAQTCKYVVRNQTTSTNWTELFLDGIADKINIPAESTWTFEVSLAARNDAGASAGLLLRGVIRNNAGATGLVGVFDTVMAKKDIAGWNADVIADNVADALVVRVSGGTTEMPVRWVATVRTTEVMY
jgi:hypothetical protein